jgi:hypothetical protein
VDQKAARLAVEPQGSQLLCLLRHEFLEEARGSPPRALPTIPSAT